MPPNFQIIAPNRNLLSSLGASFLTLPMWRRKEESLDYNRGETLPTSTATGGLRRRRGVALK